MGSGLSSPLGIAGIIFIVIGIIMAIVGIILLIVNANNEKGWYIWLLLVGGIVLGIAGGIMLAIALMNTPSTPYCDEIYGGCEMKQIRYVQPTPQVQYVQPTPQVQYVQPTPQVQYVQPTPQVPAPVQMIRSEPVGQPQFDPDPQTRVYEVPAPAQRVSAVGPYGQGGAPVQVTGVLQPQGTRYYVTSDIPNHAVNVVNKNP